MIHMKKLSGIAVSPGIVYGKAFLYLEGAFPEITRFSVGEGEAAAEIKRLGDAAAAAGEEVRRLKERAEREISREQAAIFEAHLMMLEDEDFQAMLFKRFRDTGFNMEWVVYDVAREMMEKMTASPDPLFRERAVDINDVSKRLIYKLLAVKRVSLAELTEDLILVARDLLPSEVLTMNRDRVKAIVMDMGGRTSHTAILARAFGIPAVLGLSSATFEINNDDTLVVDANAGHVYINPDKRVISRFKNATAEDQKKLAEYLAMRDLPAETLDGRRIILEANIEVPEEVEQALRFGAEGIGLYRSEFLFLEPGKAAEEERQYEAYRGVLRAMGNLPVTIRTVDIGGDKILPDFQLASDEKNPLLGWRAIRFSLAQPDLFKTQLRALLRASVDGNLRILFPLISGIDELEEALRFLEEARGECKKKRQPFAEKIEAGIMIEVPSAAMIADLLAEKADFFSIGTNDLIQYSLAVDRGNERVNYLAQPAHPGVLRLIKAAIDAAHAGGIRAAMCGEMAGDPAYTVLLLGLGLDVFSMSAQAIPLVKRIIRGVKLEECRVLAEKALAARSWKDNVRMVDAWVAAHHLS
jgi:phosphotransferase system enzyme I (PtsI)